MRKIYLKCFDSAVNIKMMVLASNIKMSTTIIIITPFHLLQLLYWISEKMCLSANICLFLPCPQLHTVETGQRGPHTKPHKLKRGLCGDLTNSVT